jgi:hypothetical protein
VLLEPAPRGSQQATRPRSGFALTTSVLNGRDVKPAWFDSAQPSLKGSPFASTPVTPKRAWICWTNAAWTALPPEALSPTPPRISLTDKPREKDRSSHCKPLSVSFVTEPAP